MPMEILPSEWSLIERLRQWRCLNEQCRHEHEGPPEPYSAWRWCPKCGASSVRLYTCVPRELIEEATGRG